MMPTLSIHSPITYLMFAETAFGFVVGVLLWSQNSEALRFLRMFFGAVLVSMGLRILYFFYHPQQNPLGGLYAFASVGSGLGLLIWYSYFQMSVRVRNTYGRNI
jgi:hypothetical protein